MRDPSCQQFSVAEGLKAAVDCRVHRRERRNLPCFGVSRQRFAFEGRVFSCEPSEPAVDDVDGSDVLPPCAVDVADRYRRSGAAAPLVEDDLSKMPF